MEGSKTDFEKILTDNKHKIYRICSVYAVQPMEPEDLFQEVIFQLWKSLPSFKGKSSVNTWVYKIAINVCLRSKLKLEKTKEKTVRFDAIQFSKSSAQISAFEEERFESMRACIADLSDADKSIIILYLDEVAYREIAEITGISENHVAVKMKRIRKKLFQCIQAKIN
jgi:RNA polymerase sigma factor (sigma-70 family)